MPIRELVALSALLLASILITHPAHPLNAVRRIQTQILRDLGRTDNWGNPSLVIRPAVRGHTH